MKSTRLYRRFNGDICYFGEEGNWNRNISPWNNSLTHTYIFGWIFPLTALVVQSSQTSLVGGIQSSTSLSCFWLTKNVNVLSPVCDGQTVTECVINTPMSYVANSVRRDSSPNSSVLPWTNCRLKQFPCLQTRFRPFDLIETLKFPCTVLVCCTSLHHIKAHIHTEAHQPRGKFK